MCEDLGEREKGRQVKPWGKVSLMAAQLPEWIKSSVGVWRVRGWT